MRILKRSYPALLIDASKRDRYRNPRRKYATIRDIVCELANMKLLGGSLNAT